MTKHVQTITVKELSSGWLWKEQGKTYTTAQKAFEGINRDGKLIAGDGSICIQLITWETISKAGAVVVKVLQEKFN